MYEYLSERVALPGLMVGIVALLIGASTSRLMATIGGAFAVCLVVAPAVGIFTVIKSRLFSPLWILYTLGMIAIPVVILPTLVEEDLSRFGPPQVGGLASFSALFGIVAWNLRASYKDAHKTCPECVSTVSTNARVCHRCGYRWQPPLTSAASSVNR
jgi:ABC-type anion transport system duplicated permease subunit